MDTLPHNGAVICGCPLLLQASLTDRPTRTMFVITLTKTMAMFFVIAFYYLTGIY